MGFKEFFFFRSLVSLNRITFASLSSGFQVSTLAFRLAGLKVGDRRHPHPLPTPRAPTSNPLLWLYHMTMV